METAVPLRIGFYSPIETVTGLKQRLQSSVPAVTRSDLVSGDLLGFANATGVAFTGLIDCVVEVWRKFDSAITAMTGQSQDTTAQHIKDIAPIVQRWVRDELAKVLAGKRGPMLRLHAARPGFDVAAPLPGPLVLETIARGLTEQRFAFSRLEDFAQWGVTQMRDPAQPYAASLCRCHLEECPNFFMAIDSGGRKRRKYCCDECMTSHHDKDAARRVRESRANPRRHK